MIPKFDASKTVYRPCVTRIASIDENSRTIDFVASSEAVDRHGDIIRVAGWDTRNYERNPVFLWAHRSSDPPIGKCVQIWVDKKAGALMQRIQFPTKDEYAFADRIFKLYKGGYLRAVSVGFRAKQEDVKPILDEDTGEFIGQEFTKQELLELSAVPIPANPEALGRAVEKGLISSEEAASFAKCGEENPPWAYDIPEEPKNSTENEERSIEHKLNPEGFMGDPRGQECAEDCPAAPPHFKLSIASEVKGKPECPRGDDCQYDEATEMCPAEDCPNAKAATVAIATAAPPVAGAAVAGATNRQTVHAKLDTFCAEGKQLANEVRFMLSEIHERQREIVQRLDIIEDTIKAGFWDAAEAQKNKSNVVVQTEIPARAKAEPPKTEDGGASTKPATETAEAKAEAPAPAEKAEPIRTVGELLARLPVTKN